MRDFVLYGGSASFILAVGLTVLLDRNWLVLAYAALVAILFLMFWIRQRSAVFAIAAVCALAAMLGTIRAVYSPYQLPENFEQRIGEKSVLEGVIVTLPDERETSQRLTVQVHLEGESTRMLVVTPRHPSMHVGDEIRIQGTFKRPEPFASDGGRSFTYDKFLEKDGVLLIMQRADVVVIGQSDDAWLSILRILGAGRTVFMEALATALPEPESALAAGIIVGGKQGLGPELIEAFTIAGMLQLVVLSGYNVGIIADAIMRLLRSIPKRIAALIAVCAIAAFVLAAGAGASAVRAAIMGGVAIVAHATGQRYIACRILVISLVLMTAWNPLSLVYDPGLQFSFLATLGLILGTPIVEHWIRAVRPDVFRQVLAGTIAAQIGVLPMLLWQTGNLSFVSVFANVLSVPLIPPAMAASAIAALSAPLEQVATVLPLIVGLPAYILLAGIILIATTAASLPYAYVIVPAFSIHFVVLAYLVLTGVVWRYRHLVSEGSTADTMSASRLVSRGTHAVGY